MVITGEVGGNVTITIGGRDVRGEELAYLDGVVAQYRYWAEKYTPLAGIAEVRAAAANGPRLDLPMLFMPAGFEKLEEHGFGERRQIERVPVDDLREAVKRYRRLVVLGEPGSGKTTTLWRLAYDYAVAAQADPRAPLPLLVPLGGYAGDEVGPALLPRSYFGELGPHLPAYLRSGRVVLLLDALNEMPQRGYRERVGRIQALLDQFPDAPVVVTCRALDYVETLRLEKLEIKPLDPERQRAYLQRYLGETEGEKLFWQLLGEKSLRCGTRGGKPAARGRSFGRRRRCPSRSTAGLRPTRISYGPGCARRAAAAAGVGLQPVHAGDAGAGVCGGGRQPAQQPGQAVCGLRGHAARAGRRSAARRPAGPAPR